MKGSRPKNVYRAHLSSDFSGGMHFHAVQHRNRLIRSRMRLKSFRGTATSAIWKWVYLLWFTTFVPILTSFTSRLRSDQWLTDLGSPLCLHDFVGQNFQYCGQES